MDTAEKEKRDIQDAKDARSILDRVYGIEGNFDHFYQKHYQNPHRLEIPFRFFEEDGKRIGVNGFMGMNLYADGDKHFVSQSCETGVLEECRGKKAFTKIVMKQEEEDKETEYIVGLPNENSHPGFTKMGFDTIAQLSHFAFIINPFTVAAGDTAMAKFMNRFTRMKYNRKFRNKKGKTYQIILSDMPELNEAEYEAMNMEPGVHFEKSKEVYIWKKQLKPEMFFVTARDNQNMVGFMAGHIEAVKHGKQFVIDDWVILSEEEEMLSVFKQMVSQVVNKYEVDMIEVPLVNENTKDAGLLQHIGFSNMCKPPFKFRGSPFIISPRGKTINYMQYCEFRNIDKDTF